VNCAFVLVGARMPTAPQLCVFRQPVCPAVGCRWGRLLVAGLAPAPANAHIAPLTAHRLPSFLCTCLRAATSRLVFSAPVTTMLSSARTLAVRAAAAAPLRRAFSAAASAPPTVSPSASAAAAASSHGHGAAAAASHGHGHGHGHGPVDPADELPWKFGEHVSSFFFFALCCVLWHSRKRSGCEQDGCPFLCVVRFS
jgi:hypothetical protein